MEVDFLLQNRIGRKHANRTYPSLLEKPELTLDTASLARMMAEGEARLADINAEFDARRPAYINLRLISCVHQGLTTLRLVVGNGDNSVPKGQRTAYVNYRPDRRPLAEALTLIREKGSKIIEKLYGMDVRTRFLRRHGKAFCEDNFNCRTGLTIQRAIVSTPRSLHAPNNPFTPVAAASLS